MHDLGSSTEVLKNANAKQCRMYKRVSKLNYQVLVCGVPVLANFLSVSSGTLRLISLRGQKTYKVVGVSLDTDAMFASTVYTSGLFLVILFCCSEHMDSNLILKCTFPTKCYPESVSEEHSFQLVSDNDAMCYMDAFGGF